MAGNIIDISSRRNAQTAYLRSSCIAQIVPIQIRRGNNLVFIGPEQNLLEHGIGNSILDNYFAIAAGPGSYIGFRYCFACKFFLCHFITPFAESTFGEFHYISLVHECYGFMMVFYRIINRCFDEPFRPPYAYGFYAYT